MINIADYLNRSAEKYGEKTAVVYSGQTITYAELDRQSTQLANTLIRSGITAGERVGIYLNKSIPAVISILATLKAGAAYVPIDPLAPAERVEYIMKDCLVSCFITTCERLEQTAAALNAMTALKIIILTGDEVPAGIFFSIPVRCWPSIQEEAAALKPRVIAQYDRNSLAYILYTSGSTGNPKGVMLSHENAIVFIEWAHSTFCLDEKDIFSSHAPFQFDLSVFDLFASIKAGGTLVLIPDNLKGIGSILIRLIVKHSITVWYSVPFALIKMLESENAAELSTSGLRLILFAGEVFPLKHLRRLYRIVNTADYYNLYGPTETNVCTFYKVKEEDILNNALPSLPIGRACSYADLFTINSHNQPCDVTGDKQGELCIAGESLMLGYWNDPGRTAGSLVKNPFRTGSNNTGYRSGDIVQMDEEGNYIYVCRKDRMIKKQGYRIELNEIEHVLSIHEKVKEAALIFKDDIQILIAFIGDPHSALSVKDLKHHCMQFLPRYMLPDEFIILPKLPRTATDKVDYPELKNQFGKQPLLLQKEM